MYKILGEIEIKRDDERKLVKFNFTVQVHENKKCQKMGNWA